MFSSLSLTPRGETGYGLEELLATKKYIKENLYKEFLKVS